MESMELTILKKAKDHLAHSLKDATGRFPERKWRFMCIAIVEAAEVLFGDRDNDNIVPDDVEEVTDKLRAEVSERMDECSTFRVYLQTIMTDAEFNALTDSDIQAKRHAFLDEMIKDYGGTE